MFDCGGGSRLLQWLIAMAQIAGGRQKQLVHKLAGDAAEAQVAGGHAVYGQKRPRRLSLTCWSGA